MTPRTLCAIADIFAPSSFLNTGMAKPLEFVACVTLDGAGGNICNQRPATQNFELKQ